MNLCRVLLDGAARYVRFPAKADMCGGKLYSIGVLEAGPIITDTCAVTLGSLIYQFGEAATKFNIKDLVDALSGRALTMYQMHQRIKLAF